MTNLFILHRFTLNQEAQEKHLLLPNPCTLSFYEVNPMLIVKSSQDLYFNSTVYKVINESYNSQL